MKDKQTKGTEEERRGPHYFMVPCSIVDSGLLARMKPSEVKVYLVISKYAHYRTRKAFPSIDTIIKESGVNKNAVCKAINRLVHYGLIEKYRAPKKFKYRSVYTQIMDPEINPLTIPQKVEKRSARSRRKDGKWGGVPQNVESDTFPQNVELHTFPQNVENKEKEVDLNRDSIKKTKKQTLPSLTEEEKSRLTAAIEQGFTLPPTLRKALEKDGTNVARAALPIKRGR